MDVILDSNIFRSDIGLRSAEFEVLMDYILRTESSIMIPQIILDEVIGLYKKVFNERSLELIKTNKNFNLLLVDKSKNIPIPRIDIDEATNNYIEFVMEKFKIKPHNLIPYNNDFLPIISQRAIERIKPAGEKGQGFRDTLIWLTIKDHCKKSHEKQISFISQNTEDFANPDKMELHNDLKKECAEENIKINYYKSLKEFIDNHSSKIEFITNEWITENLSAYVIEDLILDYLNNSERFNIMSQLKMELGAQCTSYKANKFYIDEDEDFSVYEMADNRLILNLTIKGNVDLDAIIETYEPWNDYRPEYREIGTMQSIQAYFTITIIEKSISEIEIQEIY